MDRRAAVRLTGNVAALAVLSTLALVVTLPFAAPGGGRPDPSSTSALATLPPAPGSPLIRPIPPATVIPVTNPDGPAATGADEYPFVELARSLPNFAGIWVERNQRDWHIAATGNLDEVIAAVRPHIPSGMTVYFQPAAYTYAELEAIVERVFAEREALIAAGIAVNHGSVSEKRNVITLGIDPLTAEAIATLRSRYTDAIDFEFAPSAPPYLQTSWPTTPEVLIAVLSGNQDAWLTCGGRPFPASALDGPTGAENRVGPEYDALRQAFEVFGSEWGNGPLTWLVAEMNETGATFLARSGDHWIDVAVSPEDGEWGPDGMGECRPRTVMGGNYGPAEWAFDPAFPMPAPDATELHILVWEMACSGGRPASGRMSAPIVDYAEDTLTVSIGVSPIPGGNTCPGPPGTPALVVLPEPIGDRALLDGGRYPPGPPTAQ